jgi:predicted ATPase
MLSKPVTDIVRLGVGYSVGPFVVDSLLGEGGVARVYRVWDRDTQLFRALKVLSVPSRQQRRRLMLEAAVQQRLRHPNVVGCVGTLDVGGAPAMVLELVDGPSLREWLTTRPTLAQADCIGRDVLAGVAAAHELGLVHRDLKPGNVLLQPEAGRFVARVTDFGLARVLLDPAETRSDALLGTPGYMAPEQLRGRTVDERTDVFALGLVLFELLFGRRALRGHDLIELARQAERGVVVDGDGPMALAVAAALSPDPAGRPENAGALLALWRQGREAPVAVWSVASAPQHEVPTAVTVASSSSGARTNLPRRDTAFLGRGPELALLASFSDRLITLTGLGGSGKTRLAERYAASNLLSWSGGVWHADLTAARSGPDVVLAVARALGVPLVADSPENQVARALSARGRVLLVLDNCEQVADEVASLVSSWLEGAGQLAVLATSRRALGVPDERVMEVGPLGADDAARLFVERAGVGLDDCDVRGVVDILDRIPLAIELAAARLSVLSFERLREMLSQRFRLLGGRGAGRHATLRRTLDWSWGLLSDIEQAALAQCSVFRGGFTVEAATAVIALPDEMLTARVLQRLHEHSLLRLDEPAPGQLRLGMYESVREYAADKLDDPETGARHAAYFGDFGSDERHGTTELPVVELDNLMAAVRCFDAPEHAAAAVRAAAVIVSIQGPFGPATAACRAVLELDLGPFWRGRSLETLSQLLDLSGDPVGARDACVRALELARESGDLVLEGHALRMLGSLDTRGAAGPVAAAHYDRALHLARQLGRRADAGVALGGLAVLAYQQGRVDDARRLNAEALEIWRALRLPRREALALSNGPLLLDSRASDAQIVQHMRRATVLLRQVGDRRTLARAYQGWGSHEFRCGRFESSREYLGRAIEIHRRMGNVGGEAQALGMLAVVDLEQGELHSAKAMLLRSLEGHRLVGALPKAATVLSNLGNVHRQLGEKAEALACYEESLALGRQLDVGTSITTALMNLGALHLRAGRLEEGLQALNECLVRSRRMQKPRQLGAVLGSLGSARAMVGDREGAIAAFDEGEEILRRLDAPVEVAKLLVGRCAVQPAGPLLAEARRIADEVGLAPGAELRRLIAAAE